MSKLYFNKRLCFGGAALVGLLALASQPASAGALPHRASPQPLDILRTQAVTYSEQGAGTLPALPFTRRVFFDADGDGDQDLLYQTTANTTGADIFLRVNNGSGNYSATFAATTAGAFTSGPLSGVSFTQVLPYNNNGGLSVVDIDNDGDQDLVEYTNATAPRVILNNRGTSTVATIATLPTLAFGTRHVFYDADGDGDQDLLYQTSNSTTGGDIALKLNGGNGTFGTTIAASATGTFSSGPLGGVTFTQVLPAAFAGGLDPVDVDRDGDQDLVEYGNGVAPRVILNNRGTATASPSATLPTLAFGTRHVFFDVDSDGDQDLLYQATASTTGADIGLRLNNGSGNFSTTIAASASGAFSSGPLSGITFTQVLPGVSSGGINPIDYDNDRDADVVIFTNTTPTRIVRQESTRPLLVSSTPADNATGVSPSANLVLTFDRSVVKGNGNLYLVRTSDNVVVETTPIGSTNVTGSGTTWTYDPTITLAGSTSYALRADEGIFRDADNRAFAGIRDNTTLNFTTAATTTLASINRAGSSPTNATSVSYTVTFAAAVSGLTAANFALATTGSVAGATISSVSAGPASVYTVAVSTGTGDGTLGLNLADAKGLSPTVANTLPVVGQTYTLDKTAPTVTGVAEGGRYNTDRTITFSEGTATLNGSPFSSGTTVTASGTYTLVVTDAATNATTIKFALDKTAPTVAISSTAASPTSASAIPFTVTFSESVTGFSIGSLSVTNGAPSSFSGSGTTYTFIVTPASSGLVTVNVPANAAQDGAGNGNSAATPFAVTYALPVTAAPVLTTPANGSLLNSATPTYAGTAPAGSLITVYVDGTSIGTTTATGGAFSLAQPTALAEGAHTVRATAQASGAAASANSNTNTFTTDTTLPVVVISSVGNSYTSLNPIPVAITFSESVADFSAGSVRVSGGGTVSRLTGSGLSYTAYITPASAQGPVIIGIDANSVHDLAGNGNATTIIELFYTPAAHVAGIVRLDASPTSAASVRYRVEGINSRYTRLETSNFALATSGLAGASITSVTPEFGAGEYIVTVATGTGTGTLRLDLTNTANINSEGAIDNLPFQGEVYTIVAPACPAPTSLDVSQVNSTSATVLFTTSSPASGGYTVAYTPLGGATRTVSASTSPVLLTGLTPGTTYTITVTSQCGNGQTSLPAGSLSFTTPLLRVPENPNGTTAGLAYQYYEASGANFTSLPTFASLTPTKAGTVPNIDVKSQRQRSYGYALRYAGYVTVPADGQYTFYTNSDDGSQLFIGSQLVVDNDGNHGVQEKSGSIGLQAGTHAITVAYYQDGGDDQLSISYQGPGVGKQFIPGASLRVVLPTALRVPENPANTAAGLTYQYYEAAPNAPFTRLPNFASLTPAKTGTATAIDVKSQRQRATGYALRYTGYVTVPTDGIYSFYTNSDDGSQLFIGSTLVVDNDGDHGVQERSGSIGLQAGTHLLTITYYQNGGDDQLSVSYQGPGVGKQLIPGASLRYVPASPLLRVPENPSGTVAGLQYQYYESATTYSQLPAFASEPVRKTGTTTNFDERSLAQRSYGYALRYAGYVSVPTDGYYTFFTNSDDGSQLFIGSTLVVDNGGNHGVQEKSGTIGLQAGTHAITVAYYQDGGDDQLSVSYQGPGVAKQPIPAASLRYVPASAVATAKATTKLLATSERAPLAGPALLAYPNPFAADVQIELTLPSPGAYELGVYDVTGRLVEQLPGGTGQAGEQRQLRWAAGSYASGLYLLRLRTATATQQLRLTKQ